jgi:hypothetical protein
MSYFENKTCKKKSGLTFLENYGPVHLAYNPSYSTCFFSRNNIFLSKKSGNRVFQPDYNSSRTAPISFLTSQKAQQMAAPSVNNTKGVFRWL